MARGGLAGMGSGCVNLVKKSDASERPRSRGTRLLLARKDPSFSELAQILLLQADKAIAMPSRHDRCGPPAPCSATALGRAQAVPLPC